MILPILYPSALEFWMNSTNLKEINKHALQKRKLITVPDNYEFCPSIKLLTWVAAKLCLKSQIVLMAPSPEARRWNNFYACKIKTKSFPENSFICVDRLMKKNAGLQEIISPEQLRQMNISYICVASPELCFLQAAAQLPFLDLLKLGYDLCARYIKAEQELYLQTGRDPITNTASIVKFLDTCENMPGIKAARSAARFIMDNSNSPIETRLCIIMILPLSLGGFGFIRPELNKTVHLSKEAAAFLGMATCCCDMVWEALKVIVEYDSNLTHLSKEQHTRDKARSNALQMSGYKVFTITADSLRPDKIEETMLSLQKMLGQKIRWQQLERFRKKREETIEYLFGKVD